MVAAGFLKGRRKRLTNTMSGEFGIPSRLANKVAMDTLTPSEEMECDECIARSTVKLREMYRTEMLRANRMPLSETHHTREYDDNGLSVFQQRTR